VSIFNDISICIVTYKTNNNIYKCLKNVIRFKKIFLLDNSFDINFKKIIKKKYKKINFFLSKKNLGYGTGNNFLLKKVVSKYVLILNPDAILKLNSIRKLYKEAELLNSNFGVICPTYKINRFKREKLTEVQKSEFAAPLINQVEFRKINFFDSNIFFYYEDYDACYRLKKNGKKNYIHNFAKLYHLGGKSSNTNSYDKLRNFHWGWSTFYFYKKHYGWVIALIISFFYSVRSFLKSTFILIIGANKKKAKNLLLQISGIFHGIFEKKDFFRKIY
jgi:hypothetical protein